MSEEELAKIPFVGVPERRYPLVGREESLKELHELLQTNTVVYVWGPIGVGKTRIVTEYVHRYRSSYPEGISWFGGEGPSGGGVDGRRKRLAVLDGANVRTTRFAYDPSLAPDGFTHTIVVHPCARDGYPLVSLRPLSEEAAVALLQLACGKGLSEANMDDLRAAARLASGMPSQIALMSAYLRARTDVTLGQYVERASSEGRAWPSISAPILASYTSLSSDLARDALCVTALIRDHLLRRYGHSGIVPAREWRMVESTPRRRNVVERFRRRSVGGSEIVEGVLDVRRRALGWFLGAPPANSAQSSPLDAAIEELERYALVEVTSPERVSIRGDVAREVLQIVESRPGFITRCADRMAATFRDVDRLLDAVLNHGINRIIADVYIGAKLDPEAPQAFLEGLSQALVAAAEAGAAKAESSPFPDADEDETDADKRGQLIAGLYDKALDLELHELRSLVGEKLDTLRVLRRINRLLAPPRRTLKSPSGPIRCLAITALAQSAVTGSDDGSIHVWALHTGQVRGTLRGHSGAVRCVAVTAWERLVVSASDDGTVRVWSLFMRGEPVCVLCQHSAPIPSVAVTPDARLVVAGSADGYVFVWELSTRERLFSGRIPGAPAGDVSNVVVSPDGQTMVASVGNTVYIIDPMTGEVKRALVHKSEIARVESAALGGALITITMDGAASLWDAETWTLARPIGSSLGVAQVAPTPTCKYAFIARDDYVIELRDLVKDESVLAFEGHATSITGLSSTPYGNFAVSSSLDGTLKIWEAVGASPEEYKKYELDYGSRLRYSLYLGSDSPRRSSGFDYFLGLPYGSSYNVSCGAISADGRAAITAYRNDCTLTLWDARRGRPLGALVGHNTPPSRVVLASDGRLAASMTDEEVLLWDVRDHELIGRVRVDNAFDVAVSSPKNLIVSARYNSLLHGTQTFSVTAHDLSESKAPRVLLTSEEQIRVASDNNLILMVEPCAIVLWDLASDQLIWRIQKKDQWSVDSISIGGGRAALWGPTHAIVIDVRTGAIVKLLSAKDYPRLPGEGGPLLDERFKTGEAHVEGLTLDQFILQSTPPRYGYAVSVAGRRLLAAYGVVQFLTWNFTEPNP